ncbi:hypothetical protein [Komagataeibacter europaeus]|uniref:hypothetical protein n=1 Tax=Komagataeibacter europaeus TaxID=33995 RepID=UPI0002DAFB6B|nr:hypothetical protein [Komagataeibacter europaeus]GBQ39043.1 hypothetical protein AA18890_0339 [Komagataeibacter europaeus LMG 18890]
MQTREYHTVDKQPFGPGPWDNEPDKTQWQDKATGLPCLIKRNPELGILCGYVGIPPQHPLYGLTYDDMPDAVHEAAHGGLTFTGGCSHGDEATSICHIPDDGEPDTVWWLGFDCGHWGDLKPVFAQMKRHSPRGDYRDRAYVEGVCARMAQVLQQMGAQS